MVFNFTALFSTLSFPKDNPSAHGFIERNGRKFTWNAPIASKFQIHDDDIIAEHHTQIGKKRKPAQHDFTPKLHNTNINCYFITSIFNCFGQYQYFSDPVVGFLKEEPETLLHDLENIYVKQQKMQFFWTRNGVIQE